VLTDKTRVAQPGESHFALEPVWQASPREYYSGR
jgi:hypothetical protein